MDTQILKQGEPVRLFPTYADSARERRTLSIVLASMVSVLPFAQAVLGTLGQRVSKTSKVSAHLEVVLTNDMKGMKERPDALLTVERGKKSWAALIEAKVKANALSEEQIERYLRLARENNLDAVITISNDLTTDPEHHPLNISKKLTQTVKLYHISWAAIFTHAFMLSSAEEDPFYNDDEAFIISELIRFLENEYSGVLPLNKMNPAWRDIVSDVQAGHSLVSKMSDIREMVTTWHNEGRDISLIMTRKTGGLATLQVPRKFRSNRADWIETDLKEFMKNSMLSFHLNIPSLPNDICIEADFLRRAIKCSMRIGAPLDKARNSARLNWILRQLQNSNKDMIIIRCNPKGRSNGFGAMADEIDAASDEIKNLGEITSFTLEMSRDLGPKFNSRKQFIEQLEELVPEFYKNVSSCKGWEPKKEGHTAELGLRSDLPESVSSKTNDVAKEENTKTEPENEKVVRPDWASQWALPVLKKEQTVL